MYCGNYGCNGGRGGCIRGRFIGSGCICQSCGKGSGRGIQGIQGQGGHGGHGGGGYNVNKRKHPHIDLSCLPNNIDFNNRTFYDNKWHNEFTQEQRN